MLLGISGRTAAIHANHAAHKLGCVSKHQAALKALRQGLIRRRTESRSYSIPGRQRHLPNPSGMTANVNFLATSTFEGALAAGPTCPIARSCSWLALT
jgi:hypothetical protein